MPICALRPADTPPQWTVEQVAGEENQFLLSASHGTGRSASWTVGDDGKVYAALTNAQATAQTWTVTQCERCDDGVFTYVLLR